MHETLMTLRGITEIVGYALLLVMLLFCLTLTVAAGIYVARLIVEDWRNK